MRWTAERYKAWQEWRTLASRAGSAVATAIRQGKLAKLDGSIKCADCPAIADRYDHRDYSNPLDVAPVCHRCNRLRGPAANKPAILTDAPRQSYLPAQQIPAKPIDRVDTGTAEGARTTSPRIARIRGVNFLTY